MRATYKLGEEVLTVAPRTLSGDKVLTIGDTDYRAALSDLNEGCYRVTLDGISEELYLARGGDDIFVKYAGRYLHLKAFDPRDAVRNAGASGTDAIQAPMPGVVVDVLVAVGDRVSHGAKLMSIESMKLQSTITAPHDGVVKAICVGAGENFNKGAVLVELEEG